MTSQRILVIEDEQEIANYLRRGFVLEGFQVTVAPDYTGFHCPPVYVVGYGMDLANRYRELPFIGVLEG